MTTTIEAFLLALLLVFCVPYAVWRSARIDYFMPLVVVQILVGIVLGPGVLGTMAPELHAAVFRPQVVQSLGGIATWGVMIFVMLAGIELDLKQAWESRRENAIVGSLGLVVPCLFGVLVAALLAGFAGWTGARAATWQFVLGIGATCAVTSLPVLLLLMDKLAILRQPIGQRVLRYASLDDIAIWSIMAVILLDWDKVGRQAIFFAAFTLCAAGLRRLMRALSPQDREYVVFIWLPVCGFGAGWAGLHFMAGAFLAGAVIDSHWFDQKKLDALRHYVLMMFMPVYFLITGLQTNWSVGGAWVFVAAAALLLAAVAGKLVAVQLAARLLRWPAGEASVIGWLLQTKALITIVFVNILLDKKIITDATFTALLLMAVGSTMLCTPMVYPRLQRMPWLMGRARSAPGVVAEAPGGNNEASAPG